MSTRYPFNYGWRHIHDDDIIYSRTDYDDADWELVDIPHTLVELPLQYVDDRRVSTVGWYRKRIFWKDYVHAQRYRIRFEGVGNSATVYLDGMVAQVHDGAFTPFEIEIPPQLQAKGSILVALRCDATESGDLPPFGHVVDYLVQGGLYREVSILASNAHFIENLFCYSEPGADAYHRTVHVRLTINGTVERDDQGVLRIELTDSKGRLCSMHEEPVHASLVECSFPVGPVSLWDIDDPCLYTLQATISMLHSSVDSMRARIGFRDFAFTPKGFYLNGRLVKIRALNRHQDYPHVGFAMPRRQQYRDAEFLKDELHVHMVRTSHYPQSTHFLDRCDELGLLVFEELPGWQYVGKKEQWRNSALNQLREMIERDRCHPSIVMWGVRINESMDDDDLYGRTNALARDLDPSRPTGGVRNFARSRLLEDVYTYNDFLYSGGDARALQRPGKVVKGKDIPFLVTEHTGHMYPCRASDPEYVRTEHALRHAQVMDAMYGDTRICGAIGWCMGDYHTHHQFGGGDEVCYHGVADMFRIPKLASAVYASQEDDHPVMVLSSQLRIGAVLAHVLDTAWAFTNGDRVELIYEGRHVKDFFPDRKRFPHLPHPPIRLDDLVGERIGELNGLSPRERELIRGILNHMATVCTDLPFGKKLAMGFLMRRHAMQWSDAVDLYERFVLCWDGSAQSWEARLWKDGSIVLSQKLGPSRDVRITLTADSDRLSIGDTYDVIRCVIRLVDGNGQSLWMGSTAVGIEVCGPLELIGPSMVSLSGGAAGFYVRTIGERGEGEVTVRSPYLEPVSVTFTVD